ncbi:RraA family protein [Sinobaca sp. H24]|uniref:RraA family protein n=1 Tax=Sinobaca sp. H24 TaxID=2923376 RepID=UPI002079C752|nr:RraA family protein [Sinobaca sp. H24]
MEEDLQMKENKIMTRMKKIGSSVFADVMEMSNVMHYEMKPVNFSKPLVGRARTVDLPPGDNLFLHHAIYQAEPGEVLIVDGKGFTSAAYLGELMAGAAEALHIQGIVIDGFVRDHRELRDSTIQIYAKGFVPSGPSKEGPGSLDNTISCAGTIVSPGDYVVGDEDGVVVIPQQKIEEILQKAEQKLQYEANRLQIIKEFVKEADHKNKKSLQPDWLEAKIKKFTH